MSCRRAVSGRSIAKIPGVSQWIVLRVRRRRTERNSQRRGTDRRRCVRRADRGRLISREAADLSHRAEAGLIAVVVERDINIIERAVEAWLEVDNVAIRSVKGAIDWLEEQIASDRPGCVEGNTLDPVLSVVCVEIVAAVR